MHDPTPATPSLFERIGGERTVASLVDDFYDRVLADPELALFFEHTAMNKLRLMQREFFTAALGGPPRYTGTPLGHAHHGRGITRRHVARFVEHLFATLEAFALDEREVREVIERINTYVDEVVGSVGPSS